MQIKKRISVLIPTRDRRDVLQRVLEGLEKQDCSRLVFEVIVVDDGSTDDTAEFLAGFARKTPLSFRYFLSRGESAGNARNIGIHNAQGDVILFLDTDSIPAPDVVRKHLQLQNQFVDSMGCIVGQFTMASELVHSEQARLWEGDWQFYDQDLVELNWWQYRTPNTSVKRALCQQIGGFDKNLYPVEDTELAHRLSKLGVRFYFDNSIVTTHYHPMTLQTYLKKGKMTGLAVARWYLREPKLRIFMSHRYGVFIPEMALGKKIKYLLRTLLINRATMPVMVTFARAIRGRWFRISNILYKNAYGYYTRRAFREYLSAAHLRN